MPKEDNGTATAEPGEQLKLIDTDHPAHKDLLRIARAVRSADKDRSDAQTKANEKRAELRDLMKKHKLRHITVGDVEIDLKPERVSVKERTEESDEGDDE